MCGGGDTAQSDRIAFKGDFAEIITAVNGDAIQRVKLLDDALRASSGRMVSGSEAE